MKLKSLPVAVMLALTATSPASVADEVVISLRSYHLLEKQTDLVNQDPNNNNYGLHYVFDNGLTLGRYRNSFNLGSTVVGYSFPLYKDIGMTVGVVSGYGKPMLENPFFSFNYHIPLHPLGLPKEYSAVVTWASLVVVNVGVGYRF